MSGKKKWKLNRNDGRSGIAAKEPYQFVHCLSRVSMVWSYNEMAHIYNLVSLSNAVLKRDSFFYSSKIFWVWINRKNTAHSAFQYVVTISFFHNHWMQLHSMDEMKLLDFNYNTFRLFSNFSSFISNQLGTPLNYIRFMVRAFAINNNCNDMIT